MYGLEKLMYRNNIKISESGRTVADRFP